MLILQNIMLNFLIIIGSVCIVLIILLTLFLLFAWSARKTLLRGGVAWSAKELPLKRNKKENDSALLNKIDIESSDFLDAYKEEEN